MQLSAKLRGFDYGISHWCPGCNMMHYIQTQPNPASQFQPWSYNNDPNSPTVSRSVKIDWPANPDADPLEFPEWLTARCCHYFLTDGKIQYCGDCTHSLSGQVVDLPDLPTEYTD